jgi:hypothetical protein
LRTNQLKTYDAAILAERQPGEQVIRELALKCTANGMTDTQLPWTGLERRENKPDGWWVAAGAFFEGQVVKYNEYGELADPGPVEITVADASFCIFDGRLLATIQPKEEGAAWVWIGENAGNIVVETSGAQGITGRPFEITLRTDDWTIKVVVVARVFRRWTMGTNIEETFQTGQEKSLVKAIGEAVGKEQRFTMERLYPAGLSDSRSYEWRAEPRLPDLYRLYRGGEPSVVTWPADRGLPVEEQVTTLEAIDWFPGFLTERLVGQTNGERKAAQLWFPELPPGRLLYPYAGIAPVVSVDGGEPRHPVRAYLWPSIDASGAPILEEGEQIADEFSVSAVQINYFKAPEPNGPGRRTESQILGADVYLTDRRLLLVSRLDPAGKANEGKPPWSVGHLRWEWVASVGNLRRQYLKRAGFLGGKEAVVRELEGLFVRETFPNEESCEFWFPAEPGRAEPALGLIDEIAELVARGEDREVEPVEEDVDLTEFAQRRFRSTTPIRGAVPYTIPEALV